MATELPPPEALIAGTSTATPPDEAGSLADHEEQFGPKAPRPRTPPPPPESAPADVEPSANGQPKDAAPAPKAQPARAKSQEAKSEDTPRIAELTRKWRDAERRAEDAERRATYQAPPPAQPQRPEPAPEAGYPEKPPNPEEFVNDPTPAESYYRALARHEFKAQIWQAQQVLQQQQQQQAYQAQLAQGEQVRHALAEKLDAYEQQHPGFRDKLDDEIQMPDVLSIAISTVDKSAELIDYFNSHPDDFVDAIGYAMPFDMSHQSVALLQRRLNRYVRGNDAQASGALAPVAPSIVAPRPPTPLRTGPLKTGDEPPGDDDTSLENHEKWFGPKAKHRRR